jgi:hypothetical protein
MPYVCYAIQELTKILENHALGDVILAAAGSVIGSEKRTILTDILANDLIKKFGRYISFKHGT